MQLNWFYFCGATPDDATESVATHSSKVQPMWSEVSLTETSFKPGQFESMSPGFTWFLTPSQCHKSWTLKVIINNNNILRFDDTVTVSHPIECNTTQKYVPCCE